MNNVPHHIWLKHQNHTAQRDGAKEKREGGEGHQHADFRHAQALGGIGPVAHQSAGKYRCADIMRQRIGGERHSGDKHPAELVSQMQQSDAIIPGQRRVGHQRAYASQNPVGDANVFQAGDNRLRRHAAQFAIKQIK